MNKKLTFGKLLGIIFCILAAACTVVLLFVNVYFSGQMKLIDKYYTALERDDFEGYKACYAEYLQEMITEENFADAKYEILVLRDNEKIHTKTEFVDRKKKINGSYKVHFSLTVYNDNEHNKIETVTAYLVRSGGKWFMSAG